MARFYDMAIEVTGIALGRKKQVKSTVKRHWNVETISGRGRDAFASGEGFLCGGESEEEFSQRLARAVWEANGGYCEVSIRATCFEDLPYETYYFGRETHKKMRETGHA